MPTKNEERFIADALDRVFQNGFPLSQIELLVVDAGSTDGTVRIVQDAEKRAAPVKLIVSPGCSVYEALNIALAHARGKYFLRVDARSFVPKGYVEAVIRHLENPEIWGVGGVQHQFGVDPRSDAIALATSHFFGVGNAAFRLGRRSGYVDTVYLGCFRTNQIRMLGGYDADCVVVSEDAMLNMRIRDSGGLIYLDVSLVVDYPAKTTYRALLKQYYIYGGAKGHSVLTYGQFTSVRQVIPLIFLLSLILPLGIGYLIPWAPVVSGVVALTYAGADLVFSLSIGRKAERPALVPYLLMAFPCMHIAWPLGFIARVVSGKRWAHILFPR